VAGVEPNDPAMTKGLVYVSRSQNRDGGVFFSNVNPDINKAGELNGGFASYGTATADGLLTLRAAGVPEDDDRVINAIAWLKSAPLARSSAGIRGHVSRSMGFGIAVLLRFRDFESWHSVYESQLPPQAQDGSFRNMNTMVKEDDPLIATTFAIHALLGRAG
jgi:hypothetical protein